MMSAEAWVAEAEFGLWLRKRRLERNLTQGQLADLAGISRRWLVEIEADRAEPTFSAGLRLLDAVEAELADVPGVTRWRARGRQAPGKLGAEEAETKRRELLQGMLATMVGANLIDVERLVALGTATSSRLDAMSVREAEAATAMLMAEWYRLPCVALLPAAVGHLSVLKGRLPGSRDLCSAAGWTAVLVGNLLKELDRRGDAYSHYALAEILARDVGDANLLAMVLVVRRGLLYWRYGGEPHRALDLLAEAEASSGPAAPPLLRTVILTARAEDCATVSDEVGCLRALEAAQAAIRPSATHFFGPQTPADLGAVRGTCQALLGRDREAVETFDWVLREMDPALAAWRATVAADRDVVMARN